MFFFFSSVAQFKTYFKTRKEGNIRIAKGIKQVPPRLDTISTVYFIVWAVEERNIYRKSLKVTLKVITVSFTWHHQQNCWSESRVVCTLLSTFYPNIKECNSFQVVVGLREYPIGQCHKPLQLEQKLQRNFN